MDGFTKWNAMKLERKKHEKKKIQPQNNKPWSHTDSKSERR
jgi:hypothetical protein